MFPIYYNFFRAYIIIFVSQYSWLPVLLCTSIVISYQYTCLPVFLPVSLFMASRSASDRCRACPCRTIRSWQVCRSSSLFDRVFTMVINSWKRKKILKFRRLTNNQGSVSAARNTEKTLPNFFKDLRQKSLKSQNMIKTKNHSTKMLTAFG